MAKKISIMKKNLFQIKQFLLFSRAVQIICIYLNVHFLYYNSNERETQLTKSKEQSF